MLEREPLGLQSGTVVVRSSDPRWSTLFEEASSDLHRALGPEISEVHHVGSTSVYGLCAKPILDILVSVPDFERSVKLVPELARLGYEFREDEETPDRHYFRRRRGTASTHHLSLAEPSSHHYRVTLAFRDALRRDPQTAREYSQLKFQLAQRYPRDRAAYIEGKSAFIVRVLAATERKADGPPPSL